MNGTEMETERKYLIRMPARELLARGEVWEIRQTYLRAQTGSRRVRAVTTAGATRYFETRKQRISPLTAHEVEREIDEPTYRALLAEALPDSAEVVKTRYRIPCAGHILEIDVYPFWSEVAVLEIELNDEQDTMPVPPPLSVLREVTAEPLYKNTSIARFLYAHPGEPLPI